MAPKPQPALPCLIARQLPFTIPGAVVVDWVWGLAWYVVAGLIVRRAGD